jgi:beta-glucosidase
MLDSEFPSLIAIAYTYRRNWATIIVYLKEPNMYLDQFGSAKILAGLKHCTLTAFTLLILSACGGGGGSEPTQPATGNPAPQNNTPTATADSLTTDENTAASIDLSANDSGLDDGPVSYSLTTGPNNGEVSISSSGNATYTPAADFDGTDSFVYTVTDSDGDSDSATVSITVTDTTVEPPNSTPTARPESLTINQNSPVTINLAANDTGLDDGPVNYSLTTAPNNGAVTISSSGDANYTPNTDFNGTDSFVYTVTDNNGDSDSATVSISVIETTNNNGLVWPAVNSAVTTDVETRIGIILDSMSLAEKVGQMVQAEISSASPADAHTYNLGSVLNGGGTWPNGKQSSIADWVSLADQYFNASTDNSDGGVGIPLIWGTDAVHGHNNVIGATIFPHNIGLGAANNPDLLKQIGRVTALEVAVTGIDWVFAPTLAVVRNDRWGRTYEGYSEDPEIVRAYAGEIVEGLQGKANSGELFASDRVVATAKHFIGDGGTSNGVDQGNTQVSEQELRDIHGQGYITALGAGAQTVMASYNSWNGTKLHGRSDLLTNVLKEQMGFDGFVIGDWNGHGQVAGCSDSQCAAAINAGVDMIMVPFAWQAFISNTITQAQNGTIPMSRINDAVRRILRVKARAGLLDNVSPSSREYANNNALIGSSAHRAIARDAVRQSLVLLKNSGGILPLDPSANVLVAGSGADNIGQQAGGWTITWQGNGNNNADFPGATSIYAGIQAAVASAGGSTSLSADGSFTGTAPDVAIVVFGEYPYAEGAGDIGSMEYQVGNKSDLALLKSLRDQNIPVVSIFISGRPLWVNAELNASNAFVAAWLPGSEGAGIADVIFANSGGAVNYDFSGQLSFSWPNSPSQFSLNRNQSNYDPLFAYGFGLTYSDTDSLGDNLDETGITTGGGGSGGTQTVFAVPGTVQAEDYSSMSGIQLETTSDVGGGSNTGYVDEGDWLEYQIDVASSGNYRIEYRLASQVGSSGFNVLVDGVQVDNKAVPNTGGWQAWTTLSSTIALQTGEQTLRLNAVGKEWNLNWIRFTAQ